MTEEMVSITVCVRDGAHWVDACLESLVKQTYRPLQIIAVNDGSVDGTEGTLQSWHDPEGEKHEVSVRVLHTEARGLSAARQLALEESEGVWVAITDIDCRPHPTWIEYLMQNSTGMEEEDVVAVTGRVIFEEGDTVVSRIRCQEIEHKYRKRSRLTTLANGPCSMFRQEALEKVGGFNPEWYHAEDMEVSLNLIAAGGVIVHTPDAVVHHVPESSLRVFLRKRSRDARAHLRIIRKHPHSSRQGPGFDFIGRSWYVLGLAPLLTLVLIQLMRIIATDVTFDISATGSRLMVLFLVVYLILGSKLSSAYLGRGSFMTRIGDMLVIPVILVLWSIALWKGMVTGALDALMKKHGH